MLDYLRACWDIRWYKLRDTRTYEKCKITGFEHFVNDGKKFVPIYRWLVRVAVKYRVVRIGHELLLSFERRCSDLLERASVLESANNQLKEFLRIISGAKHASSPCFGYVLWPFTSRIDDKWRADMHLFYFFQQCISCSLIRRTTHIRNDDIIVFLS